MTPLVALDCRKISDYGVGSYLNGLLEGLCDLRQPGMVLVGGGEASRIWAARGLGWWHVPQASAAYSLSEQIELPRVARRVTADLWHFPHYVTPLLMRDRMVVTIHDLIHLDRKQDRFWPASLHS